MSRSGYSDDCDQWALIRWRGAVTSAVRGKRGQAFLSELLAALDALPEKRLIGNSFGEAGAYCTLGVIGASRGADMPKIDLDDDDYWESDVYEIRAEAAHALKIPEALAAEIMFYNDEGAWDAETPEQRWARMRLWVSARIKDPQP